MRGTSLLALVAVALAGCLSAPAVPPGGGGSGGKTSGSGGNGQGTAGSGQGSAGNGAASGTTGEQGNGGSIQTSGNGGSAGAAGNGDVSGTAGGGDTGGLGGTTSTGGASGGAAGTMGTAGRGGSTGTAGTTSSGGVGGTTGMAGTIGSAGSSGAAPTFAMPLRLEDPCGQILDSSTCLHEGKQRDDALPFSAMTSVTIGGTQGTMYQVKIHVRGIVEPTQITGGTVGTPRQFVTGGSAAPDNGNSGAGAYNQWRLTTTVPNQSYYLNAYPGIGHNIYAIDYMETITIGGGSTVKLDVHDANAHLITNTSGSQGGPVMTPAGAAALANNNVGQFVQIDTVP